MLSAEDREDLCRKISASLLKHFDTANYLRIGAIGEGKRTPEEAALYVVLLKRHTNDKMTEYFDTANYLRIKAIPEGERGEEDRQRFAVLHPRHACRAGAIKEGSADQKRAAQKVADKLKKAKKAQGVNT